jgi:hypothetical protein
MNKLIIVIFCCFSFSIISAQSTCKDCFSAIKDSIRKQELASFCISIDTNYPKRKVQEISVYKCTDSSIVFINDGLRLEIVAGKFDSTKHVLTFQKSTGDYVFLSLIDGKKFYGKDGGVPKRKINCVSLTVGQKDYLLPNIAFSDLYEPNFCNFKNCLPHLYQSVDKKRIYIYMFNSDGAGGYEVCWIFENGEYVGRLVDSDF